MTYNCDTLTFTGLPGLALPKTFTTQFLLNMGCYCCNCRRRLHHKIHVLAFVCSFLLRDTYLLQMGRTDISQGNDSFPQSKFVCGVSGHGGLQPAVGECEHCH